MSLRLLGGLAAALFLVALAGDAQAQPLTLEETAERLADAWAAGEVSVLVGMMGAGDLRLDLGVREHPALSLRQARAALKELLEDRGRGPAVIRRARVLGGEPARGFVELDWRPRPPDAREVVSYTVFLGLELRDGWRVTEIRVLGMSSFGARHGDRDLRRSRWHPTVRAEEPDPAARVASPEPVHRPTPTPTPTRPWR